MALLLLEVVATNRRFCLSRDLPREHAARLRLADVVAFKRFSDHAIANGTQSPETNAMGTTHEAPVPPGLQIAYKRT